MPVIRLALLLLIGGGLVLFALQNWSPVLPLVMLGFQTQALPLAAWMVAAILAGALTTLVISGLFGISNTFSGGRSRRPVASASTRTTGPRETQFTDTTATSTPWTPGWTSSDRAASPPTDFTSTYTRTDSPPPKDDDSFNFGDDWENVGTPMEEWEDWSDYPEPVDTSPKPPPVEPRTSSYSSEEREEWEDWEEDEPTDSSTSTTSEQEPRRTTYEVRQEPKTSYRSGTIYSYSYRDSTESGAGKAEDVYAQTKEVYDADYRVIIPPQRPLDEDDGSPSDEDDWDFEDDDFGDEDRDRPRRP